MASASARAQDLPPKGGYGPIQTERIKLRTIIGVKSAVITFTVLNIVGFTSYYYDLKRNKRNEIELRSAQHALTPMLMAERDRIILKQMRINRDEEISLMKDRKDWIVGTTGGLKMYYTLPDDHWEDPINHEYYAHCKPRATYVHTQRHIHWV